MQKFFILTSISIWIACADCEIKQSAPKYLYPSLDSPYIMNLDDFTFDTNFEFSILNQVNSTSYYSMTNTPQQTQWKGQIISSAQFEFFIYLRQYSIVSLKLNWVLFLFNYIQQLRLQYQSFRQWDQKSNLMLPDCLLKLINFACFLHEQYDLNNGSFLQPTPYQTNISFQNITNNLISTNQWFYDTLAYTSSILNQTIFVTYDFEGFLDQNIQDGYLTDMVGQGCKYFHLQNNRSLIYRPTSIRLWNFQTSWQYFPKNGFFMYMNFIYFQDQNRQQVLIATQNSILILEIYYYQNFLVDEILYPIGFSLDINSKVQLFADDQYIIISNSFTFLVYEHSSNRLFWIYQLQEQSLIQYDNNNKIITIISQQSIQAFQLYQPQIYLQFNQINQGTLNINLKGLSLNCSFQIDYQVILNNDRGPYVNFYDSYQVLVYQESQFQCLNCLFTGQNLTYSILSYNIDYQSYQVEQIEKFSNINFSFYYIYQNPINSQQYAIFYQLENQQNLSVIYCGLPYCYYSSDYESLNQSITTIDGQINSFYINYLSFNFPHDYTFSLYYNIINQISTQYQCTFVWQYTYFQCFSYNLQISELPPNVNIQLGCFGSYSYYQLSNPYYLILQKDNENQLLYLFQDFSFVPRQIYYNNLLYNNLLFIDNVFQLNIYELILNGTQLSFVTSIKYPIQQGNTSVGVGLLQKAIVITQIDDNGNQFIIFYDPLILRPLNMILQPQPQIVQLPEGAQIQFPIVSSYSDQKFYLVWQYNQVNEIASLQPSSTINNMLLTSTYINGNITSIQAIDYGIYDILVCRYNEKKIIQIVIWNKFFIQLSSKLILQNDTFNNVSIVFQAESQYQQVSIIKQYEFINQIFQIQQIKDYQEISLVDNLWFKFLITEFYQGLVNIYESNNQQQSPLGPFSLSNNFYNTNIASQLFLSNPSINNGFILYFQNNSGVYQITNFFSGYVQQINEFAPNLSCPIMYQQQNLQIVSICQQSPTLLIFYSNYVQYFNLEEPLQLVNGQELDGYIALNYGHVVQLLFNNEVVCQYTNDNITITNVFILQQVKIYIILQIQNSDQIIILEYEINYKLHCNPGNQRYIWIDQNQFGAIVYLDAQNYTSQLTVTTTKMTISYEILTYNIYGRYLISYTQTMIGIQTKIINNYIIAIYNTSQYNQLNYTVIVYSLTPNNKIDFPIIAYYNEFIGSPQQFYICQDGTLVYTYIYQNQTGFTYLQILPYVYVAIDYNNLIQVSQNSSFAIKNYLSQVSVGNEFNKVNITFNITYTNYLGIQNQRLSVFGLGNLILLAISSVSIISFACFIAYKILTKNKME